jgi:hypothetical protein
MCYTAVRFPSRTHVACRTVAQTSCPHRNAGGWAYKEESGYREDRTFDRISRSLAGATSRRQALKLLGGGIAAGALGAASLNQAIAAPKGSGSLSAPITYTLNGGAAQAGSLLPTDFTNTGGTLSVVGQVLDAAGNILASFTSTVTGATGSCTILDLTLGPINLDLLGLVITTNAIHINITAQSGPGNLLGNLLCAVANLLNGGGPLGALAGLLNRILGALGA